MLADLKSADRLINMLLILFSTYFKEALLFYLSGSIFIGSNTFLNQKTFLNLSILLVFFWIVTTFVFISKRNLLSFSLTDQRFWKRVLGLFWSLEFFLFLIYMYLWYLSPAEFIWGFDYPIVFKSLFYNFLSFFSNILLLLNVVYINYILLFLKFFNINLFIILSIINLFSMVYFFLFDFYQIFFNSIKYSFQVISYNVDLFLWEVYFIFQKIRVKSHYLFILVTLKFWHSYFILIIYMYILSYFIFFKKLSFDFLAFNNLNIQFLFCFFFIFYTIFLKIYFILNIIESYFYLNFFKIIKGI